MFDEKLTVLSPRPGKMEAVRAYFIKTSVGNKQK